MKKRIASFCIACFLLFNIIPLSVVAISDNVSISVGTDTCAPGETVTIPISITNNSGFVSMSLSVTYDVSVLTLISCEYTDVISGSIYSANYTTPYCLTWENDTLTSNISKTGTIAYLTFLVHEDAAKKTCAIVVRVPTDGVLNAKGESVLTSDVMGSVTVSTKHVCSFGDWEEYNGKRHVRYCECGEAEYARHKWDNGKIVEKATHEDDGKMIYTCEDCGDTQTEIIDAEGHEFGKWSKHNATQHKRSCSCGDVEYEDHEWDDGVTVKVPTATESGEIRYTCTVCGETRSEILSPVPDDHEHAYKVSKIVEATCTAEGYTLYRCEGCGATKRENVEAATGHSYSDRVVAPTCQAGGYTEHVCTACGDTYKSNPTEKLAHNYVDGVCTYCKGSEGSPDTPNPPIDPDSPVAGDINGDGAVNDADAELLMKYHAGWQVTLDTSRLDVNNDMRFNNKDVTRLLQYLAGWDVEIH